MVCSADDLLEWKDFPKGLRVLLLDEDNHSAAEIKLKLEEMDYVVSTFHNEDEALKAISNICESFHVAIVEVSTGNSLGSFKFLENAKNLPTIMTSNTHCLSTMMKCIAHGAAEFLQKPLSEDKLKNIWQHVVHKAFNAGEDALSESMKPVKETVASMLHLKLESSTEQNENQKLLKTVDIETNSTYELCDHHNEQSMTTDRFPAPSTPQLKQSGRFSDDEDCQEITQDQQPNSSSMEQEHGEPADGECSKSVDTTCNNSSVNHPQVTITTTSSSTNVVDDDLIIKEEEKSSPGGPKTTESNLSSQLLQTKDGVKDSIAESRNRKKISLHPNSCGSRANRKKMKVDWTTDLHKRFVQAVEQLGVDQAIPSRILELMKAEGLTRHNVASHLQKYRLNRRHILPKEDHHQDRIRWQSSPSMQRTTTNYHYQHNKPIMAYPSLPLPYHHSLAHHQHQPVCHVWGHPAAPSNHQMWGHHPGFPAWQHPDSRIWKVANTTSYSAAAEFHQMNVDGWGNPVNVIPTLSHHQVPCTTYPQVQNVTGYAVEDHSNSLGNMISSFHLHQQDGDHAADDDEVEKLIFIDKIVKEAMSKPWLPLPLGLNPPSTESVLNELQKQGIPNIPPPPPPPPPPPHPHPKHYHQY